MQKGTRGRQGCSALTHGLLRLGIQGRARELASARALYTRVKILLDIPESCDRHPNKAKFILKSCYSWLISLPWSTD